MFFVEGVRNVVHAIESGFQIETLVYSEKLLIVPIARRLVRDRRRSGTPTFEVTPEVFRQISMTPRASGVGAVVAQRWSPLHHTSPKAGLCWVVLEAVRSEGNLGSLIRTSEAVGGAGFILAGPPYRPLRPCGRPRLDGGAVPAGLHPGERPGPQELGPPPPLPCHRGRHRRVGRPPPLRLSPADDHRPGRGAQGLTPAQRGLCTDLVRIPMEGAADSLNLAVAGSLLMYEVYRTGRPEVVGRPDDECGRGRSFRGQPWPRSRDRSKAGL